MEFNNTNKSATAFGATHMTSPLTGSPWVNEAEAQDYFDSLSPEITEEPPVFNIRRLTNLSLKNAQNEVIDLLASMYPVSENTVYTLTGSVVDEDGNAVIFSASEQSVLDVICTKGESETDHLYLTPIFDDVGGFELRFRIPSSGNWIVSANKQNQGLEFLGVDFRFEFDTIDIKCRQVNQ